MNDSSYFQNLSAVGRLIHRRAKKTKLLWRSCVPSGKKLKSTPSSKVNVRDMQIQTTPSILKSVDADIPRGVEDNSPVSLESCVVDSSRNFLDSDVDSYLGSYEYFDDQQGEVPTTRNAASQSCGNCHCLDGEMRCKWRNEESAIMGTLASLREEINSLRVALNALQTGDRLQSAEIPISAPPPPPPMPPPPPPPFPSPAFAHSQSLQTLPRRRQSASKIHFEEMASRSDRGKPIITLEELQNVKLRHVSSVSNLKC